MRVFITKYALTMGIQEKDGRVCDYPGSTGNMIQIVGSINELYHKPYWHETREEAVEQAEKMRLSKLKSLRKSLAKFEKLTFA